MNGGEDILEETEKAIYESSELGTEKKADLLTAMAIFAGLKDDELGIQLVKRRRDIMIESPVYEFIEKDAKMKGREEGLKEGLYSAVYLGLELTE